MAQPAEKTLTIDAQSKTKVILTTQDVCELFCPLRWKEVELLTQIINETQYPYPQELIVDSFFEGGFNFLRLFEKLKDDAMEKLQKITGVLAQEYSEIGCDMRGHNGLDIVYTYTEDYVIAIGAKWRVATKDNPTMSPLCIWFLKQIDFQF